MAAPGAGVAGESLLIQKISFMFSSIPGMALNIP
jgi:hypothetical protein